MTWLYLAHVADGDRLPSAPAPLAVVAAGDPAGNPAGSLVFWDKHADPRPVGALRVDERVLGAGPARWVSLCRFGGATSLPFDDGMVSEAVRRRLRLAWPTFASALLVDWSRIAGAVTGDARRGAVADDPFARIFPGRLLQVEAGTLGTIAPPTGPGITRYGSGNPWPWDRYAGQVA